MTMDATDLSYEIVWKKVDPQLTEELTEFWLAQGALPSREAAAERAPSVAAIARDKDRRIVGVSSVFPKRYKNLMNNMLYGYRSFVAPEWRRYLVGLVLAQRVTEHLENEYVSGRATECNGIVIVAENPDLSRGWNLAIDPRLPYVFIGTDERGHYVRLYWFEGAEIVRSGPSDAG
jgi:hypothetical protein